LNESFPKINFLTKQENIN